MPSRGVFKVPPGAAVPLRTHVRDSGAVLSSCLCHQRAAVTLGESLHQHRPARGLTPLAAMARGVRQSQELGRHNHSERDGDVEDRPSRQRWKTTAERVMQGTEQACFLLFPGKGFTALLWRVWGCRSRRQCLLVWSPCLFKKGLCCGDGLGQDVCGADAEVGTTPL